METKITTVTEMIERLYNLGIGESHQELEKAAGGLLDPKFALLKIFKEVKMSPQIVKNIIKLLGSKDAKKETEDFFLFYCSYVDHSYITKMYHSLGEDEFIDFISKLNNIAMILNSAEVQKYKHVCYLLADELHKRYAKKQLEQAEKESKDKRQG